MKNHTPEIVIPQNQSDPRSPEDTNCCSWGECQKNCRVFCCKNCGCNFCCGCCGCLAWSGITLLGLLCFPLTCCPSCISAFGIKRKWYEEKWKTDKSECKYEDDDRCRPHCCGYSPVYTAKTWLCPIWCCRFEVCYT